jgi:predicted acylesterase/phospholipase RssA
MIRAGGSSRLKLVNLTLQGGGAHGAFAWGVLDRLLDERRVAFDGISATSAGAINATKLFLSATGLAPTVIKTRLAAVPASSPSCASATPMRTAILSIQPSPQ